MRTIIAGGRDCYSQMVLQKALKNCGWKPSVVLCGGARGADTLGRNWAEDNDIPVELYPAEWNKRGKSAGFFRNIQMGDQAEALIALWDGKSKGTAHMIKVAQHRALRIFIQYYGEEE